LSREVILPVASASFSLTGWSGHIELTWHVARVFAALVQFLPSNGWKSPPKLFEDRTLRRYSSEIEFLENTPG